MLRVVPLKGVNSVIIHHICAARKFISRCTNFIDGHFRQNNNRFLIKLDIIFVPKCSEFSSAKSEPVCILLGANFHRHENWVHVDTTDVSCHSSGVSDVLSACHAVEKNSSIAIIFAVSYERDGATTSCQFSSSIKIPHPHD